jgi:hypothetical protein
MCPQVHCHPEPPNKGSGKGKGGEGSAAFVINEFMFLILGFLILHLYFNYILPILWRNITLGQNQNRMKKVIYCLLFLMAFSTAVRSQAQGFYIRTTDQKVKTFDLATLQSLSFQNSNLLLKKTTGSTESFNLSTVKELYFSSLYTGSENISVIGKAEKLSVYPNPAQTTIRIMNAPLQPDLISIIGMDGHCILQTQITQDNPAINISGLAKGLYIVKVNNQAIKFIKQ